jgi:hypothetical protein
MMFDLNNPEVRSAIIDLSQSLGSFVSIIPLPVQNGEKVDGDYTFTQDDIIGDIDESITQEVIDNYILSRHWSMIRWERDQRLKATDVWALPDRAMTQEQIDYRQALRDITTQEDPRNIVWPEKPE